MFLRKHRRKKNGKVLIYWSMVETIRTPKGPRQKTIGYLGDLDESEEFAYGSLKRALNGERASVQCDFHSAKSVEAVSPSMGIYPNRVRVERVRDFGDCYLGFGFWRMLKLDDFFARHVTRGQEEISWDRVICYLTVARLCEASSKLKVVESFTDRSALGDILGIAPEKINKDRLYRAMDELLRHKNYLGMHLKERYGELFKLEYELLLYDMTSTFFEGQCPLNPQACRGYSRDQRSDCKQVTLALVVTKEGFPLYFEIFDGNRSDVTTVEDIVEEVEKIYGTTDRVWVMDRGMVSDDNLEWLRERGTLYIVGTPKSWLKKFEKELTNQDWNQVESDVEVKIVTSDDYQEEMFILCRSQARKEKEHAMIRLFSARIEKGLNQLQQVIQRPKRALKDRDKIQRKIGALLKVNSRAAKIFDVKLEEAEGKLNLVWTKKTDISQWQDLSDGCYLLRSNMPKGLSAQEMWKAYINLTKVEEAFRISKQELGLRPVWHQLKDRVQAHVFICFLALCLQKTIEETLPRKGIGRSVRKVIEEFQTVKSMDVIMPTIRGDELKISIVSEPEPALKILLQRLRIQIPKRLSQHRNVVETFASCNEQNQVLIPF